MQRTATLRKVPAASVPYGHHRANGTSLWAAYDGEVLVATAATKTQARRAYRLYYFNWCSEQGRRDATLPQEQSG